MFTVSGGCTPAAQDSILWSSPSHRLLPPPLHAHIALKNVSHELCRITDEEDHQGSGFFTLFVLYNSVNFAITNYQFEDSRPTVIKIDGG